MRIYKYNEIEYAKVIKDNGFLTKHRATEMRLLVLYYRDILGYSAKEREKELLKFCKKYDRKFSLSKDYILFDKILKLGCDQKQKLVYIEKIPITLNEFNYINQLDISMPYKKVLFTFLVQDKLNKAVYSIRNDKELSGHFFSGGSAEYREVKTMSQIPTDINFLEDVLNSFISSGLITPLHTGVIELSFIDKIVPCDDIKLDVKQYEVAGLYFEYYSDKGKIRLCVNCGTPYKQHNNKHKFCSFCKDTHNPIFKYYCNYEKKCECCGEKFYPKSNNQVFCSNCKNINTRNMNRTTLFMRKCDKCGVEFPAYSKIQKYCTDCSSYKKKGITERTCIECGDQFKVDSRNTNKIRCDNCQKIHSKTKKSEWYKNHKNNMADDFE